MIKAIPQYRIAESEVLTPEFGRAIWEFVRAGEYEIQEKSEGGKIFYRFRKPTQPDYPAMLEY